MATTELIELAIETSKQAYVPYSLSHRSVLVAKDGVFIRVNTRMLLSLTNCGERTAEAAHENEIKTRCA